VADYGLAFTNSINFGGWGLNNIQSTLPDGGVFNQVNGGQEGSSFFVDQNVTNALATGDSHTYTVTMDQTTFAQFFDNMRVTLVWTDPPGDPAAAIKLVNNLELVVSNWDTGDVYIGNDISPDTGMSQPWNTNGPPNVDIINNVQSVILPPFLANTYSITVKGLSVNVNSITAQTNNTAGQYAPNIVQDFALVISVGEGDTTNAFSVTDNGIVSNPTAGQDFTIITTTNAPLMNQYVGASSPELGTNALPLGNNTIWGPNGIVTIGQTNQWHFYVVTNNGPASDFTNAAFITFQVDTLSIPRMGVYEQNVANATKPEANIDLFVSQDPSLTNLNPVAVSNCIAGVGSSRASLYNAGTQFVFYTNSAPGQVYYIGVQAQDQMASEYSLLPVFTDIPFGGLDQNGNQIVNGLLLPMPILKGNNAHPGVTNAFALAIMPMEVEKVTVTNWVRHPQFGDVLGTLSFGGQFSVLNNHHGGYGNTMSGPPAPYPDVYDDSPDAPLGTTHTDSPGDLLNFRGKSALGPWILNEIDDAADSLYGQIQTFTLLIQPHRDLKQPGIIVSVPPGGWFIDWVDVPAGYTNLTLYATNVTPAGQLSPLNQEIQMYERYGNDPTLTEYDQEATLTNGTPPGNTISVGPPLSMGKYFVGLYNPNVSLSQSVFISATLGADKSVNDIFNYSSGTSQPLSDDAVTSSTITVPNTVTQLVASVNVGLVIKSPRISDYAFTLVSPTGQRVLLMENRGGNDTNGAGGVFVYTNILNSTAKGGAAANTNYLAVDPAGTVVPIRWNFYSVPDQMTVYDTTNPALFSPTGPDCIYNTGFASNAPSGLDFITNLVVAPGISNITIVMNQFGNPYASGGDQWYYTAGAPVTNYQYLMFTDDTNLATVPIKFAEPPFNFTDVTTNFQFSNFDLAQATNYFGPTNINDGFSTGWSVPTNVVVISTIETNGQFALVTNVVVLTNNLVSVVSDSTVALTGDALGSNYLALGNGTITRQIPTVPGRIYNVTFWYRGPGISGWWRGEGNGTDSSDPENNNNNGTLIGRFNFPAGEVGQAFGFQDLGDTYQFAGTNTYVQVPASRSLNVGAGGGLTVEGWINPTNLSRPQPLVEWIGNTNTVDTNLTVIQGPILDSATGHFYYLLASTNWIQSEMWAQQLGGHLVHLETANEGQWVYDTFTAYGTLNRDLWTGLDDLVVPGVFRWSDGGTNVPYANWSPGEPTASIVGCPADRFVAIMGPTNSYPGLWNLEGNNRQACGQPPVLPIYGVVEVPAIATNGVQFWISGTNWTPGETNTLQGCLYANIVDTNYGSHVIISQPGLLTTNVFQHVALTYNTNSGIAALYLNGTNVATTNLGVFVPKTDGDMLIGLDMSRYTNNYYGGAMDEMSVYGRSLSLAEISAIYQASAFATNGLTGKFDPAITPAAGLAEAVVTFGTTTNVIYGVNNQWQQNSYTFTATTNFMPLTITGKEPGILLDAFALEEAPLTNLYYFPEQALNSLIGTEAGGNWTLQVWDNRAGAYVTNVNQLVNWQLSFVLESNAVYAAALQPETPTPTTVPSGQTVYYSVTVPAWAHEATNILVSSSVPVDMFYYSPANPPATGAGPDATMLTGSTAGIGSPVLVTNATPAVYALQPGQTYYIGLRNNSPHAANAILEVDYDILGLTNGVPFGDVLTNDYQSVRYFAFDVGSNAYEATFQLLKMQGNADLVVRKGAPLPALNTGDYGSFNTTNVDENIYVLTNSAPVPLSAGRWYLGVVNRGSTWPVYNVLARELDLTNGVVTNGIMPAIINLTNGVPFTWTAGPGADLTNFFHFYATNTFVNGTNIYINGLRFELFGMTGDADLTVQTNTLPLAPQFYQSSQNGYGRPELVYVFTNNVLTNLALDWYLGVPNHEITNVTYSIVAEILTNAYFPAFPGAEGAGGGALGGRGGDVYHVYSTDDSGIGTLRDAIDTAVTNRTVVFDVGGAISLQSPLVITNSYLTIAGETAPGGGVTVAGDMTSVEFAREVIIRDIRFRRGAPDDSIQFLNVSNVIADHISAEWTSDNLVSVLNSSNVTVQWSVVADNLLDTNFYKNPSIDPEEVVENFSTNAPDIGLIARQGSGSLSFHHNLYADNPGGSLRLGDSVTVDFVNNVVYNWLLWPVWTGGANDVDLSVKGSTNRLNLVCNYFIAGPDTATPDFNGKPNTNIVYFGNITNATVANWLFQTNNFIDSDTNGVLNGSNTGSNMFANDYTLLDRGAYAIPVSVDEAYVAYERVLDFAGVNLAQRDTVDSNVVTKVRYQTGRIITSIPFSSMVGWWKGEGNALDGARGNNGTIVGSLGFAEAEVGQGFNFNKTNAYVFVPANPSLNVSMHSGFTVEEWINPSNVVAPMPLFGWGTNSGVMVLNSNVIAGPIFNTNNGHYYYLLQSDTWSNSEVTAIQLGGHLATIRNLSENLWVSNTFANYGGVPRSLWIGLFDPTHDFGGGHVNNFTWVDGESTSYRPWAGGEPNNCSGNEYWGMIFAPYPVYSSGVAGLWNDLTNSGANCGIPGYISLYGVVESTNPPTPNPYFWISVGRTGCLYANLLDATNGSHAIMSAGGLLQSNIYQHVAWTYDTNSGMAVLYLNGNAVASGNLGSFIPNTTGDVYLGKRLDGIPTDVYSGEMDEVTIYKRALSQVEIQAIYQAGPTGKSTSLYGSAPATLPYLDTDQDGLPDFWEATFTPAQVYVPSNNNDRNGDGYTDLEEYNNWLAEPHTLTTVTNPVGVDLYQVCGKSGRLAFYVTNGIHGSVYLTNVWGMVTNTSTVWSNTFAIFTPTNSAATNYFGYGSFDFFVTNLDTAAFIGPITVSAIISPAPLILNSNIPPVITPLLSGVLDPTNTGGTDFYQINVTTNDYGAVFELINPTGPMALVVKKGALPSLSSYDYYTNAPPAPANQEIVVLKNSTPVPLSPGTWYLGAVNEAGIGSNVVYDVKITLLQNIYAPNFNYPSNSTVLTNIETVPMTVNCAAVDTNNPPLPLRFALVSGPVGLTITNSTIYWTPTEAQGPSTNSVVVSVSNGAFTVTNAFTIVVKESNLPPILPYVPNQYVIVSNLLVVTNTAIDMDIPTNGLAYTLYSSITASNLPSIDTNGIITWTPTSADAGSNYLFTAVVTDTNPWAVNTRSFSVTNSFYVSVFNAFPPGTPETNIVAPNSINWFVVVVPTNAIFATNTLLFATLPVNLWYSTNLPPSITNSGVDSILLSNVTSGISILRTNLATAPTNLVAGGVYFLGVQNTNLLPVTNALQVNFAFAPPPGISLPFIPTQVIAVGDTLVITNTATDTNASATLIYNLANAPLGASVSANGIVTWPTSTNMPPTNVVITTIVNDLTDNLSATNSFAVLVLPGLNGNEPQTNIVGPNGITWFFIKVPVNADMATNFLLFATAPLNLWYSTNVPPSITNVADAELLTNSLNGFHVINTTSAPVLVPGSRYFLGVQNTNIFPVTNAVEVTFHLLAVHPSNILSIVQTNRAGTNGFLLTWFAPTNEQFHVQWSAALNPLTWTNFNGVVSYATFINTTNSQFEYFDNGSQTGGFGATRFYRLLLLTSPTNTAPFFLNSPSAFYVTPSIPFVFTNQAGDWDVPPQILTYSVANTLAGTNVMINPATGVITWTPDVSLLGQTNTITTTVFDNGVPLQSAVNSFTVVVSTNGAPPSLPVFAKISVVGNGLKFQWSAPTNEQFQVRWSTNLSPAVWHAFPVTNTSTTGNFIFVDTNSLSAMKFYQLILLP